MLLTATQQRNARKRRAKQKLRQKSNNDVVATTQSGDCETTTTTFSVKSPNNNNDVVIKKNPRSPATSYNSDPSLRYISSPCRAPLVRAAQKFFAQCLPPETASAATKHASNKNSTATSFPIYIGPTTGWRTIAKLAVRNAPLLATTTTTVSGVNDHTEQQRLTIGLFAPGTHTIVPVIRTDNVVTNSGTQTTSGNRKKKKKQAQQPWVQPQSVHHPSISMAIYVIQELARKLHITPFCEIRGTGQFRHLALAVQRHTNRVQCIIVWNADCSVTTPTPVPRHENNIDSSTATGATTKKRRRTNGTSHAAPTATSSASSTTTSTTAPREVQQLVQAMVDSSQPASVDQPHVPWHSIWIHYNSSWKHSNAIFSQSGHWELLYNHPQQHHGTSTTDMSSKSQPDSGSDRDCALVVKKKKRKRLDNVAIPATQTVEDKKNGESPLSGPNLSGLQLHHHPCPAHLNGAITEYIYQSCGDCPVPVPLYFLPQVFRQGNITAFSAIVKSIRQYIQELYPPAAHTTTLPSPTSGGSVSGRALAPPRRPKCLELYGGVGTIGLHIADLCSSLVCSDENPYNVPCFDASADALRQSLRSLWTPRAITTTTSNSSKKGAAVDSAAANDDDTDATVPTIRYVSASAAQMVAGDEHSSVDIIIVDPPRKGLEDSVSAALITTTNHRNNPKQKDGRSCQQLLVYVSCGFDAFQRDYRILTGGDVGGGDESTCALPSKKRTTITTTTTAYWKLVRAEGHVLFPGSDAIETLAFFQRE